MTVSDVFMVVGGLALFLYGMKMMGDGLGLLANRRLKVILEKLTRNRFMGLLVGILIAGVIQSSNATTVMVVGFVNAKIMDLSQAVGVIMGAKIGTTVTGQLIALKVDAIAPIIAFVGVAMVMFMKNKTVKNTGFVIAGLGVLFMGMSMMQEGMEPLKDSARFQTFISGMSNPLLGVLAGVLFTACIQSSSASVGVLQAMAAQGALTLTQAAPLIYGINIGACISALLSSIGGSKDAKRAALLAALHSTIGMLVFVVVTRFVPFVSWVGGLTPDNPMRQVANLHSFYNVILVALLFPFSNLLVKLTHVLIPGEDTKGAQTLLHITESGFGAVSIGIAQVTAEIGRMEQLAAGNLHAANEMIYNMDPKPFDAVSENEETIDYLNKEITRALVRLNALELSEADAAVLGAMYHIISDLERIGDHAMNMAEYAIHMEERKVYFSEEARAEIADLRSRVETIVADAWAYFSDRKSRSFREIDAHEEEIDDFVDEMAQNHIERLNAGRCNADTGLIFREIITDLERVSDHALNIAQAANRW